VIAQDPADAIIHYPASLLSGVTTGLEMELVKEDKIDASLGWIGVGETGEEAIREERIRRGTMDEGWIGKDEEALSYPVTDVLGCRRVVKFATVIRGFGIRVTRMNRAFKEMRTLQIKQRGVTGGLSDSESDSDGGDGAAGGVEVEMTALNTRGSAEPSEQQQPITVQHKTINHIWHTLCLLDGLAGIPLGRATKMGRESVCSWLSCALQAGPKLVARRCQREGGSKVEDKHFSPR